MHFVMFGFAHAVMVSKSRCCKRSGGEGNQKSLFHWGRPLGWLFLDYAMFRVDIQYHQTGTCWLEQ
jgi:hypothetical protein